VAGPRVQIILVLRMEIPEIKSTAIIAL